LTRAYVKGDVFALLVLAAFPLIAYVDPLLDHRLLGPGDGVALHLPLRTEAFRAYHDLSLPFLNTREFLGTPLLAAYRGGVLYPLTVLLSPFEPFAAFQALVVISLCFAGILTYLYLKRLGAGAMGAFVGALSFAYGPYLLSHFEDTATLVAAPMLPLVLLAAESHMNRASASRLVGLGVSIAFLVLAGSPEALKAGGALVFGRLLLGHTLSRSPRTPSRRASALAILLGLFLSAPQWLPTLALVPEAGRQVTGLAAEAAAETVSGLSGLILKTVTHTPAASLAIASLPLLFERLPVRVLLVAVLASLALQTGRGPLLAPGALPLVLEFALAALAGLALDEQWRERRSRRGRRLRAYFLVASLASVGALSIAAAALGGLPDRLAAAVGVFAIALITYFAFADAESEIAAGVFLLPLVVSFAIQPASREVFKDAPTRSQLVAGTPTRRAVDLALSELGPEPRILTLVRAFPSELALDFGFAGYGALATRVQANGYDPMAPISVRRIWGEMGARGFLSERSLTPSVDILREWSIDAVQVATDDLTRNATSDVFLLEIEPGFRHRFALPFLRLKSIRVVQSGPTKADLNVYARVNGDREVLLGVAGDGASRDTVPAPSYRADMIVLEIASGSKPTRITALEVETQEGARVLASHLSAYLSQPSFREIAVTPQIRAFRVEGRRPRATGTYPVVAFEGPTPGGGVSFRSEMAQAIEVALPAFPGWNSQEGVSDISGRLLVKVPERSTTHLVYAPPLFLPGVALFLIALGTTSLLLAKPAIIASFLKSRRDEGK
jgi:hypothetical protein